MKRLATLFLMILFFGIAFSQFDIDVLSIKTNDLVYDSITDRIYVTIPSSNGTNGNSIGIINPNSLQLEKTVFIGSEPTVMTISDDGQFIYAGFSGTSSVRKFVVATQEADIQFSLGSDGFSGPFYAYDICAMPNNPNTIAVSRIVKGSTGFYGTAVYDSGIERPINSDSEYPNNNSYVIEFYNDSIMFGYNNHSTGYDFNVLKVETSGVKEIDNFGRLFSGFGIDKFVINKSSLYSDYGTVVDVSNFETPYVAGTFSGANGKVAYDRYNDLVCYATYETFGRDLKFKQYDPNTFLLQSSLEIPDVEGEIYNLITCGKGRYAFNTEEGDLVLITDPNTTSIASHIQNDLISIYPNPARSYIKINNQEHVVITSIALTDLQGKVILNKDVSSNDIIDISNLHKGVYLIKMFDTNKRLYLDRLIKQ